MKMPTSMWIPTFTNNANNYKLIWTIYIYANSLFLWRLAIHQMFYIHCPDPYNTLKFYIIFLLQIEWTERHNPPMLNRLSTVTELVGGRVRILLALWKAQGKIPCILSPGLLPSTMKPSDLRLLISVSKLLLISVEDRYHNKMLPILLCPWTELTSILSHLFT